METKNAIRRLSMPAEAAERLLALKGSSSWEEFISEIEERLEKPGRGKLAIYFEKNLTAMDLHIDQVCQICKRHTTMPQVLKEVDYPYLLYSKFEALFKSANMGFDDVREFFVSQGLRQTTTACPFCQAYEGQIPATDILWNILNFYKPLGNELAEPAMPFKLEKLEPNKK